MASGRKGNRSAGKLHQMTADYGIRAATALNDFLPGRHRDKIVAGVFNVSLRMAKYLRKGQYWTTDRLTQASVEFGAAFDLALAGQRPEIQDIAERLARLEERFDAQVADQEDIGLAHRADCSVHRGGERYQTAEVFTRQDDGAGEARERRGLPLDNKADGAVTAPPHAHRGGR